MKSFISWVIANFEGIIFFGVCAISAVFPFCFTDDKEFIVQILVFFGMVMFGITIVTFQTKTVSAGIIKYLLGVALIIWGKKFIAYTEIALDPYFFNLLLNRFGVIQLLFIGSSVIGLLSAIYAFSNFDDVISRRILYHNSNVSLFEMQWSFVIDRFMNISFATFINLCWLCLLAVFMNHMQYLYELVKFIQIN